MIVNTLDYSMECDDITAFIITLIGNKTSEDLSRRCQSSCTAVQQPWKIWPAFDGTSGEIQVPPHLESETHWRWLKQMNDRLTITEVATILSHYSLWAYCAAIDKPVVVLEHDAIMVKRYSSHNGFNQINYLGNLQQYQEGKWPDFPPHAAATNNYKFICRAHAYAIDPAVARQLVAHVVRFGLAAPADMLIRADIFPIVQTGFYAFDAPAETTITGRDQNWQEHAREIFSTF